MLNTSCENTIRVRIGLVVVFTIYIKGVGGWSVVMQPAQHLIPARGRSEMEKGTGPSDVAPRIPIGWVRFSLPLTRRPQCDFSAARLGNSWESQQSAAFATNQDICT